MPRPRTGPRPPGRILLEDYLRPRRMTQLELCERTGLGPSEISRIVRGSRRITAALAWIIGPALNTPPRRWLEYQLEFDLWHARLELDARRAAARKRGKRTRAQQNTT